MLTVRRCLSVSIRTVLAQASLKADSLQTTLCSPEMAIALSKVQTAARASTHSIMCGLLLLAISKSAMASNAVLNNYSPPLRMAIIALCSPLEATPFYKTAPSCQASSDPNPRQNVR